MFHTALLFSFFESTFHPWIEISLVIFYTISNMLLDLTCRFFVGFILIREIDLCHFSLMSLYLGNAGFIVVVLFFSFSGGDSSVFMAQNNSRGISISSEFGRGSLQL